MLILAFLVLISCSTKNQIVSSPSSEFEGDYSLIIDKVISYGKEEMFYAFKGCTKIKSTAHLHENYSCQFKLWTENWDKFSKFDMVIPDSSFLFDRSKHLLDLNLDYSLINHCVEIIQGTDNVKFINAELPAGTLIFSPLIPTTSPHFYTLWVHVVRDRDPPEMVFSFLKEGTNYIITAGSWDDQCF